MRTWIWPALAWSISLAAPATAATTLLSSGSGSGSPSSAPPLLFEIKTAQTSTCNRNLSIVEVTFNRAGYFTHYKSFHIPQLDAEIALPDSIGSFDPEENQIQAQAASTQNLQTGTALFPMLVPIVPEAADFERFCKTRIEPYHALMLSIRPASFSVQTGLATFTFLSPTRVVISPKPSVSFTEVAPPIHSVSSEDLEHVVIYDPRYERDAQELSLYRTSSGVPSMAQNVKLIPGYHSFLQSDTMPSGCVGYEHECFYVPGSRELPTSRELLPGLYGFSAPSRLTTPWDRLPDVAGLIRAFLRDLRSKHPSLKYVVLFGNPEVLPIRYQDRNLFFDETAEGETRKIKQATDFYYSDLETQWNDVNGWVWASHFNMRYPDRWDETPDPLKVYDTTQFTWPVRYPFARYLAEAGRTAQGELLAVGRITHHSIGGYTARVRAWEEKPRPFCEVGIATADNVYKAHTHLGGMDLLGSFQFFGEEFGSGFPDATQVAQRCAQYSQCVPPANTWQAWAILSGNKPICSYSDRGIQALPVECKVQDPTRPELSLPGVSSFVGWAARTNYSLLSIQGHGSPFSIALNTPGFNKSPKRYLNSPDHPTFGEGSPEYVSVDALKGRSPGGFVVSSACDPGQFIRGEGYGLASDGQRRSLAESLLSGAGAPVGVSMNFWEGFYNDDPNFDVALVTTMKTVLQKGSRRMGEALRVHLQKYKSGHLNYQVRNRIYFGDPAVLIGSPAPCDLTPYGSATESETLERSTR